MTKEEELIDVFGEDSKEVRIYRTMYILRNNYAEMLIGKLQKVITDYDKEHKSDLMATLNLEHGKENDSLLSHFVTEATHCMDIMVGIIGGNTNPLEGVYDRVKGQTPYTATLTSLENGPSNWPVLDSYNPGHMVIRVIYTPKTDMSPEVCSKAVYVIRSDGELFPMIWLDAESNAAITKAMEYYGIIDPEDYQILSGNWFYVEKNHHTSLIDVMRRDPFTVQHEIISSELPLCNDISNVLNDEALDSHTATLMKMIDDGRVLIHYNQSPDINNGSVEWEENTGSLIEKVYIQNQFIVGKLITGTFGLHAVPYPISNYAARQYHSIISRINPSLLETDQMVVIELLQKTED